MAWTIDILKSQGFDKTTYDFDEATYRVRCSQCEAVIIGGYPTHERGCPNEHAARTSRDEAEDDEVLT